MSTSLLWTLSSNCSRESLCTKVDLLTVYFRISVGKGIGPTISASCLFAVSIICLHELSINLWSYALILNLNFSFSISFFAIIQFSNSPTFRRNLNLNIYFKIFSTTPAPTVLPPSRIANLCFSSRATGAINLALSLIVSPGITISTPAGKTTSPVTSVVLM